MLVALGGIFVAIPYFLNLYQSMLHPNFKEISPRFGLIDGNEPILGFLMPILFILFLFFFPKKWREQYIFSLALLITPFIVLNQQLITNRIFETGHYHWYTNQPLAVIFLIIILFYQARIIQEKWKLLTNINVLRILAVLIIGVSFYTGITIQIASYIESKDQILRNQRFAPIIEWLNTNAEKEEVVLTDLTLAELIPTYTSLNSFDGSSSYYYLAASNERMLESLFLFYRLDGLEGKDARDFFLSEKERAHISRRVYGEYYKEKFGGEVEIPDEKLFTFAEKYQSFLSIPISKFLKKHKVKYVVWDTKNHLQWQLNQYPFLSPVYEKEDFIIYLIQ